MKIFVIHEFNRPFLGGNLNMKQLLNPIFFARSVRHPDSKRQRKQKVKSQGFRQARELKNAP